MGIVPSPPEPKPETPRVELEIFSDSEAVSAQSQEGLEIAPAAESGEGTGSWKCPVCDSANAAENTRSSTSGTDLFEYFAPRSRQGVKPAANRSSHAAMVLSVIPGAGHIYLGRVAEGVGRIVLATWWFGTVFVLNAVPALTWIGTIYLLAGLGLVGVTIIDAYAVAEDEMRKPILSRNVIYFASLGLFGILFMGSMLTFMTLRR
ncbi:MAG: hypothetical protein ACRD1T_24890 [Acidimicrobiia bacterium]